MDIAERVEKRSENARAENFPILVADLDGTVLRSDILYETFWDVFGRDWRCTFRSLAALFKGKAALKRYLSDASELDVHNLPYDDRVVEYVEAWRKKGGRTALVTASDENIAKTISDHLGVFDEVHGSNGINNLKGRAKANFLNKRFSVNGYWYIGDSTADIPVWADAEHSITVNASERLRSKAESLDVNAEHLLTTSNSVKPYLKTLRPHQWLKNILIFLPVLASQQFTLGTLSSAFIAFCAFCLVASSVYVLNDLIDLKTDRLHARKHLRPFASGDVPIAHGGLLAGGLLLAGVLVSISLGPAFFATLVLYYIATIAYSLGLKRHLVIDICVLAGLYTVRIIAGGAAAGIPISMWLLAFSIFFFFSLAAIKRQAELVDMAQHTEPTLSGRDYRVEDLPLVAAIVIGSGYVSVLVMALYLNSSAVAELYSLPAALWGICLVLLYWITRMAMVTHRGLMHDDPLVYASTDSVSQICFILITVCVMAANFL